MKKIQIKDSLINGRGLFAEEDIKAGEDIQYIEGPTITKVVRSPEESATIKNWIGIGKDKWINTHNTFFEYINHSCYPNSAITGTRTLVALSDIKTGDEITIDYSMTDADPHWHLTCACGAKNCRKEIRAIYTVPQDVFKRHFPHIPETFQKIFIQSYISLQDK